MRLRVTKYGEPILREVGAPVTEFNPELKQLAEDMIETMYAEEGIGLAAQQIDKALQICVVDVRPPEGAEVPYNYSFDGRQPPLDLIMPMAIINPKVTIIDDTEDVYEEGCLSFPDVRGRVHRPIGVRCEFQDTEGNPHIIEADGLLGRCILHEVDHLNGELFIDLMEKRDLRKNETRIKKLKRATRDFLKAQK
ncbi:peptide deformylase [Coraliomargarita akajimensis]|uniref:Peptide deformylase n=1 Tax=Coraliomargarita akajimensis (strain DSM 45221 / IAM 15411 / JCM 23193 / KCTC 12865 / 04OKA010-24) TaxID=583355 RepID=D5EM20_CORAD|nr:peptide deformylase [Coraliomargarita akajimensis]ADE55180.1 peptide deformylase [Coraliomargarita akajimensis DSM 45221]